MLGLFVIRTTQYGLRGLWRRLRMRMSISWTALVWDPGDAVLRTPSAARNCRGLTFPVAFLLEFVGMQPDDVLLCRVRNARLRWSPSQAAAGSKDGWHGIPLPERV